MASFLFLTSQQLLPQCSFLHHQFCQQYAGSRSSTVLQLAKYSFLINILHMQVNQSTESCYPVVFSQDEIF